MPEIPVQAVVSATSSDPVRAGPGGPGRGSGTPRDPPGVSPVPAQPPRFRPAAAPGREPAAAGLGRPLEGGGGRGEADQRRAAGGTPPGPPRGLPGTGEGARVTGGGSRLPGGSRNLSPPRSWLGSSASTAFTSAMTAPPSWRCWWGQPRGATSR